MDFDDVINIDATQLAVMETLKKSLGEDVLEYLSESFTLDTDRSPTLDEQDLIQEITVDALCYALIDLLITMPLGDSAHEREARLVAMCKELTDNYKSRYATRQKDLN